jgi:nucleoside-diphosphate-sugar epimerase
MFVSQLITHALLNQRFIMSDGLQKRDLVYIDDVTDAIMAGMAKPDAVGRVINIGSGCGIPLRQLARAIWSACNADSELLEIGSVEKSGDAAIDTEANISLAREILDWSPRVQIIDQGDPSLELLETIEKMRADLAATSQLR